jgi:hypothetical protein
VIERLRTTKKRICNNKKRKERVKKKNTKP